MARALLNGTNGLYVADGFDQKLVLAGTENGVPEARTFVEREISADSVLRQGGARSSANGKRSQC
jgi:hypothetical protein